MVGHRGLLAAQRRLQTLLRLRTMRRRSQSREPAIHPPQSIHEDLLLGGKAALACGLRCSSAHRDLAARNTPAGPNDVASPISSPAQPFCQFNQFLVRQIFDQRIMASNKWLEFIIRQQPSLGCQSDAHGLTFTEGRSDKTPHAASPNNKRALNKAQLSRAHPTAPQIASVTAKSMDGEAGATSP
jgi:hypothetical protein